MSVKIPPLFKCKERTDVNRTQYVCMLLLKTIPVKVDKHLIVAVLMMAPNMYSPVLCSSQRGGRAAERKPIQTRVQVTRSFSQSLHIVLHNSSKRFDSSGMQHINELFHSSTQSPLNYYLTLYTAAGKNI